MRRVMATSDRRTELRDGRTTLPTSARRRYPSRTNARASRPGRRSPRAASPRSKLYETTASTRREHAGRRVRSLMALLALHRRPILHPALPEADARAPPEQGFPWLRAAAQDPAHHDDPSPGDHELPGLSDRSLHRHRGFGASPAGRPAHAAGHADRLSVAHSGRSGPRSGTDRVRTQAPSG